MSLQMVLPTCVTASFWQQFPASQNHITNILSLKRYNMLSLKIFVYFMNTCTWKRQNTPFSSSVCSYPETGLYSSVLLYMYTHKSNILVCISKQTFLYLSSCKQNNISTIASSIIWRKHWKVKHNFYIRWQQK